MKDTIKFEFYGNEKSLTIKSLSILRNELLSQERDVAVIDDILFKFSDNNKVELDRYEVNIVINALNQLRTDLKNNNESPNEVNNLILKLIEENNSKKKVLSKILRRDNGRRF